MSSAAALLIDGQWITRTSADPIQIINPANELVTGTVPCVTPELLEAAIASAQSAFEEWSATPPIRRAQILRIAAGLLRSREMEIAQSISLENGKTLAEARAEVGFGAEVFEWYAEEARRIYGQIIPARTADLQMAVLKEPIGIVAAFASWNAPIVTSAKKIASALAAGCTVIAKPSEETPTAPLLMAKCLMEAGLPQGALNIVYGNPQDISSQLLASPRVRAISFTGSTAVGKQLVRMSADQLQKVTMELGGNAPVIVMDDVDPAEVARQAVIAKFRCAGQICSAPTRFFIQERAYDRFLEAFIKATECIKVGDGFDPTTTMGPLINQRRLSAMESLVADAVNNGAKLLTGGKRHGNRGFFFLPTVLKDVPDRARFMTEEPFGPLASVSSFSDVSQAITAANSVAYGLAAFAFANDQRVADRICAQMQTGHVAINSFLTSLAETPFGGRKDSGYGIEGGSEGISAFSTTKFVVRGQL